MHSLLSLGKTRVPAVLLAVSLLSLLIVAAVHVGGFSQAEGPEDIGIRYRSPDKSFVATIGMDKAIAVAGERVGDAIASSPSATISSQLVLFSDDEYYTDMPDGKRVYYLQDVPAWIITYDGVQYPLRGGPRGVPQAALVNHEVNVAVNAATGEVLELYSFK